MSQGDTHAPSATAVEPTTEKTNQDVTPTPLLPPGHHLPNWHKSLILFVASLMTFCTSFSSTCLFPAESSIAETLNTTSENINICNAGVLIVMGSSSLVWAPLAATFGRRTAYNASICVLFLCSIGTALSINFEMFIAMRILAGFEGTFNMVAGQTLIADIFDQKRRGTAVGFFQAGSVLGPAIGPCIGGVIVAFTSWRVIFWVQAAIVGVGFVLSVLFVPSIVPAGKVIEKPSLKLWATSQLNILRVFTLLIYPNIVLTDIACGFLAFTQYGLLAAVSHLINPRFHLTSSLVSGLFYLAPGGGFLIGSMLGGKWSDITMLKRTKKRGERLPQDRLHSGMAAFFLIMPAGNLIYGWCLEYDVGGIGLAVVAAFFTGFGLMAAFSSLNTYCGEAIPAQRTAVIASKYFVQYLFGAASNAVVVPLIDSVGVGLACTIEVILTILAGILVLIVAIYGRDMQDWVDIRIHPEKDEKQLSD